jgi:hypothetical protein
MRFYVRARLIRKLLLGAATVTEQVITAGCRLHQASRPRLETNVRPFIGPLWTLRACG